MSRLEKRPEEVFRACRSKAKHAGIPFLFTFEEWWAWWQTDDRWAKRGHRRNDLVMARADGAGPWALSNVVCTTREKHMNLHISSGAPRRAFVAFCGQRKNAERRGISFLFTFEEWWAWWQTDDRWAKRGKGRDHLVMARLGDAGPYCVSNVYCTTGQQNADDFWALNRPRRTDGICRPVSTPEGRFSSVVAAAAHHRIAGRTVMRRIARGWDGWAYLGPPRGRKLPGRKSSVRKPSRPRKVKAVQLVFEF